MRRRSAGLVLHPTSFPGPHGIGDLGPKAERFIDWASTAGQSVWQVLPLGPTGYGNSPYGCLSSFGGNPLLVSPERLVEEGWLDEGALAGAPEGGEKGVAFEIVAPWKRSLMRTSWERFRRSASRAARDAYFAFVSAPEQAGWLEDWALFSALKEAHGGVEWTAWSAPLARREAGALDSAREMLAGEIAFHEYEQFVFFRQWDRLKQHANRRGVRIMGDVPFYVAFDSADVWAHAELFKLDGSGRPLTVAGVPPDYFSKTGQLWGNPIYRWDAMEQDGFAWWIARLGANLRLADFVRLDHFRGFAAFWEVPASEKTAVNGVWSPGPGQKLFTAVWRAMGDVPVVAEDLGVITPDVVALRTSLGMPGMKVLQFAFGEPESEHRPDRAGVDAVYYTGTHDNDTSRGWFASLPQEERARACAFLRGGGGAPGRDARDVLERREGEPGAGIVTASGSLSESGRGGQGGAGAARSAGGADGPSSSSLPGAGASGGASAMRSDPCADGAIEWEMISAVYRSEAWLAMTPLQDALGLGSEGRMNTPGRESGNWAWRMRESDLKPEIAARLRALLDASGRLPG